MKPSRTTRLAAVLIAVFSLLFAQLAMASYVCPGLSMPDRAATADIGMHDMAGCTGMDDQQPSLCHADDHGRQQSLDKPELPQVPPFAAVGPAVPVLFVDLGAPVAVAPSEMAFLARVTAPPLSIRHCCFRI
jgi:hypothetical protein